MDISDCMKRTIVSIPADARVDQAVKLVIRHNIGTLPVVDDANRLLGVVSLRELLALVMPDFVHLLDHIDFVHDFGAWGARQPDPEDLARPVSEIMHQPVFCEETSSLLRAAALIRQYGLVDLPVVDNEGRLVGLASHVDIGTALMRNWHSGRQSSLGGTGELKG